MAFLSDATNLVEGQTGGPPWWNVFLYDRLTGRAELASGALGSPTAATSGSAEPARVSTDGRHVAFISMAQDLVAHDFNFLSDVFLYSRDLPPGLSFFTLPPCRRLDATARPGTGARRGCPANDHGDG